MRVTRIALSQVITTPSVVDEVCKSCTGKRYSERQFHMKFGTSKYVCGLAWDTIAQSEYDLSEDKLEIKDLLKCMNFYAFILLKKTCVIYLM